MKYTIYNPNGDIVCSVECSNVIRNLSIAEQYDEMKKTIHESSESVDAAFNQLNNAYKLSAEAGFGQTVVNAIKTAIKTLKEWFTRFKKFIVELWRKLVGKIISFFKRGKATIPEQIQVVDDVNDLRRPGGGTTTKSTSSKQANKEKMVWVKMKDWGCPVRLSLNDLYNVFVAKQYTINPDMIDKMDKVNKVLTSVIADMVNLVPSNINEEFSSFEDSRISDLDKTLSQLLITDLSKIDEKLILKTVKNTYLFMSVRKMPDSAQQLVDSYAKFDVKIQKYLDLLQNTEEYTENVSSSLNQVKQCKSVIDKLYNTVLRFYIKQTNIADYIQSMTVSQEAFDKLSKEFIKGNIDKGNDKYIFDSGSKVNFRHCKIEITKSEFDNLLSAGIWQDNDYYMYFGPKVHINPEVDYLGNQQGNKEITKEIIDAADKVIELLSRRHPRFALKYGKDIVLYDFAITLIKLPSNEKIGEYVYGVQISGSMGHGDTKTHPDISGVSVLYHTHWTSNKDDPIFTELRPSGHISKSEGHYYSGKGRIYCSKVPVTKNGIPLDSRAGKNLRDITPQECRVYEINVSDIDVNSLYIDPEHSGKSPNVNSSGVQTVANYDAVGKLEGICYYIETDDPIPCKFVGKV